MTSGKEGLSPLPSHDYPEYETPSKQYENGPITSFGVSTGLPRPYHNKDLRHPPDVGTFDAFLSSTFFMFWSLLSA